MIGRVIEFSAKNKVFIFAIVAIALAAAFQAMKTMPLDAIPDLSDTQVIV